MGMHAVTLCDRCGPSISSNRTMAPLGGISGANDDNENKGKGGEIGAQCSGASRAAAPCTHDSGKENKHCLSLVGRSRMVRLSPCPIQAWLCRNARLHARAWTTGLDMPRLTATNVSFFARRFLPLLCGRFGSPPPTPPHIGMHPPIGGLDRPTAPSRP